MSLPRQVLDRPQDVAGSSSDWLQACAEGKRALPGFFREFATLFCKSIAPIRRRRTGQGPVCRDNSGVRGVMSPSKCWTKQSRWCSE
jgi:hypothetical protein